MSPRVSEPREEGWSGMVPPPLPESARSGGGLPAAPPTRPGMLGRPPRAPVWHMPIGIVAIVFATAGVLRSGISAISPWVFERWGGIASATMNGADPFAGMRAWAVWLTMVHVGLVLVAGTMIAGAIGVMNRHRWGVWLMVAAAILRVLFAIGEAVVAAGVQQAQLQSMANQPGAAFVAAVGSGMAWFGAIISIGMYSVFPAFVLIWFVSHPIRRDVRDWDVEQVRDGRAA